MSGEDTCDRCGTAASAPFMSYFNTEMLCETCYEKEQAHPDYEKAREAEAAACQRGDMNFKGIGAPPDLLESSRKQ
jgi:hypothetical protein